MEAVAVGVGLRKLGINLGFAESCEPSGGDERARRAC